MITMETNRLIIKNFHPDDWQDLQEMVVQYQASEWAKFEDPWPTSTEEVKGMAMNGWHNRKPTKINRRRTRI